MKLIVDCYWKNKKNLFKFILSQNSLIFSLTLRGKRESLNEKNRYSLTRPEKGCFEITTIEDGKLSSPLGLRLLEAHAIKLAN